MTSVELKQKRKSLHEQMLDLHKRSDENGVMPADAQEQWDKIDADVRNLTDAIARAERAEKIAADMAEKEGERKQDTEKEEMSYRDAFLSWVQRKNLSPEGLKVLQRGTDSQTIGAPEHGGRLVPDEWANSILKVMAYYSGALEAVDVITTGAGNKLYFPVVDETAVKGS